MFPNIPDPILDAKELELDQRLTRDYAKFCKPNFVGKGVDAAGKAIVRFIPEPIKKLAGRATDAVKDLNMIKQAMEMAGAGFGQLTKCSARLSISKAGTIASVQKKGANIERFDDLIFLRSYQIEKTVEKANLRNLIYAAIEGGATGAPGVFGIPFNLALSFFLFFRATQWVALSYGYDVQEDPGELVIASEVTLKSLEPRLVSPTGSIGGTLAKLMVTSQLASLQSALAKEITFRAMIENGGLQLLFVHLRSFGHASARKALENSGQKGLEAGLFKGLLEKVASRLPKNVAAKSAPFLGAFMGAGIDSYLMSRVLTGANLIYHKRFIAEKALRIQTYLDSDIGADLKKTIKKRVKRKTPGKSKLTTDDAQSTSRKPSIRKAQPKTLGKAKDVKRLKAPKGKNVSDLE